MWKMGLLDKLWDDTVAGPPPENGLGKLRKYSSAPSPSSPPAAKNIPVTRSITIVKTASFRKSMLESSSSSSVPLSPAGSSEPGSPFASTTPRGNLRKFRRKSTSEEEPRNPTVYDWIVISALDR